MNKSTSQIGMFKVTTAQWITSKVLLCSPGNCAHSYMSAWMGGEFGGEGIHAQVQVWLSPLAVHLKLSQHC